MKKKGGSFIISFGDNGGFYIRKGQSMSRICLGFVAFTVLYQDFDTLLTTLFDKIDSLKKQ